MSMSATDIYTLSLHDALPICFDLICLVGQFNADMQVGPRYWADFIITTGDADIPENVETPIGDGSDTVRSEEHTSELQSRPHLVCRLPLEKQTSHPSRQLYNT